MQAVNLQLMRKCGCKSSIINLGSFRKNRILLTSTTNCKAPFPKAFLFCKFNPINYGEIMKTFITNTISLSLLVVILGINPAYAECGSCQVHNKATSPEKSSALVTAVPESGSIEGFVIASCGKCNFDYKKSNRCDLTVKIGDMIYPVKGTSVHDHGNPHSADGFCSAVRVAYVSGTMKKNTLHADTFTLMDSPK